MERYFLIDEDDIKITILSQCFANSYEEAQREFDSEGWVIGEVKSEFDWNQEIKTDAELNSLESQSSEQ